MGTRVLHLGLGAAALFALSASLPAAPFFGPAMLGALFGSSSALSISCVAINTATKSLGQPALMLGLELLAGWHNPQASQGVAAMALSSAVIAVMLAPRYKLYQSEAASTMLASSVLMLAVLPVFLALTGSVIA